MTTTTYYDEIRSDESYIYRESTVIMLRKCEEYHTDILSNIHKMDSTFSYAQWLHWNSLTEGQKNQISQSTRNNRVVKINIIHTFISYDPCTTSCNDDACCTTGYYGLPKSLQS